MSGTDSTLAIRLTPEQKQLLLELKGRSGRTMAAIVHRALGEYVFAHAKRQWPSPPARPKRRPLRPVPSVPRRPYEEQLTHFISVVARHHVRDDVTEIDWPPVLAEYKALKRAGQKRVSAYWHQLDEKTERGRQYRALHRQGAPLPGVPQAEQTVLFALLVYEKIRNQWGQRTPVDRDQLPPEKRLALQASDRKRKANSRAAKKAQTDAQLYILDDEAGVVVLPSNQMEGAVDAAAE